MSYIVISDLEVCGKIKGETIAEKDLLNLNVNIDALIAAGHISNNGAPAPFKSVTKEGDNN